MNPDKIDKRREPEYPVELESQFIMRLPEEPAKALREVVKTGDNIKNRLTIQIDNDMRHGEVRFDHWLMHAKIVDLPCIIESHKTIDNKSLYKTADICQMMICKEEPDVPVIEEEPPAKNKKKDPFKVDKKFLWPHGVTPPTKNVRKRRFRKTLRKKYAEAPEIEKEVKRLLRADQEAVSYTWEIIVEDDDQGSKSEKNVTPNIKAEKKVKPEKASKSNVSSTHIPKQQSSNVVDIFGGAVSDSEEEDNRNVHMEDSHLSAYDSRMSDNNSMQGVLDIQTKKPAPIQFSSKMFDSQPSTSFDRSDIMKKADLKSLSSEDDTEYGDSRNMVRDDMSAKIEQLRTELEELKQRRQRTQQEISGMENMALRQRFQEILHTMNQDIMYKEMEYQGMITLQNSEDI